MLYIKTDLSDNICAAGYLETKILNSVIFWIKVDFPLHTMGEGLAKFLKVMGGVSPSEADKQGEIFQETVWRFEKLGLREWMKSLNFTNELSSHFPNGMLDLNNQLGKRYFSLKDPTS